MGIVHTTTCKRGNAIYAESKLGNHPKLLGIFRIVMIYIIIPSEEYVPTNVLVALCLCKCSRRTLFKSDQLSAASISSATPRKWHLVASSENDTKQAQGILEHSICTSKEQSAIAATFATFQLDSYIIHSCILSMHQNEFISCITCCGRKSFAMLIAIMCYCMLSPN
ncbi:hypothetical protein Pelo_16356 [Pelomyxa schiedti]|nr:hypothetical protein Pelo_16356 [Pelomyxa schiedti]